MKNLKTVVSVLTISALSLMPFSVNASKTENVYTNMDYTGTVKRLL